MIRTKFFNVYLPLTLSVILLAGGIGAYIVITQSEEAESAWYSSPNGTWNYRQKITIDHTKVNTTTNTTTPLTNFPVLISTTNVLFKDITNGGYVGKSDGSDIVFTGDDQLTKLDHEIEAYTSSTGQLIAWVRIPSLGSQVDTTLYMYYGNQADPNNEQNATGVWNNNYKGVWHFPDGGSLSVTDSTGLNTTTNHSASAGAGKVDGAAHMVNASSQFIDGGSAPTLNLGQNFTVSAWVKFSSFPGTFTYTMRAIVDRGSDGSADPYFMDLFGGFSLTLRFGSLIDNIGTTNDVEWNASSLATGTWYHFVGTYDGSTYRLYKDGIQIASSNKSAILPNPAGTNLGIGNQNFTVTPVHFHDGDIDEVNLSNSTHSADWVKTEYLNQSSPSTFASVGSQEAPASRAAGSKVSSRGAGLTWYNTGGTWTNRRMITINHNYISTTATTTFSNFPLLISIGANADNEFKYTGSGGKVASSTGGDILFTAADGTTKLDHELEYYASSTGQTITWVRIPTMSGTQDTTIYMYYGNASSGNQQNATGVWDSNYAGVWHLNQGGVATSTDSTINGNHGTNINITANSTGKIDGASVFNKTSAYVSVPYTNNLDFERTNPFSFSGWVNFANNFPTGNGQALMGRYASPSAPPGALFFVNNPATSGCLAVSVCFGMQSATGNIFLSTVTNSFVPYFNQWTYLTVTYDGSSNANGVKIYINGVQSPVTIKYNNLSSGTIKTGNNWRIGDDYTIDYANGGIDEVEVSNAVRSADWIKTQYNNQNSPGTFYNISGLSNTQNRDTNTPLMKARGGVKFR